MEETQGYPDETWGLEPKAWAHGNSVTRKHLGGATTLSQEGAWGRADNTAGRGLGGAMTLEEAWGGRDDATAGRILETTATPQKTSRGHGLGHPVTNEHPSRTEAKTYGAE